MILTICTPTYNRAYTLKRVYVSLIEQNNKNFEWIIIDDGSTDETEELVNDWISEKKLKIIYYKQKNQGKHIALNKGVSLAEGELFTCLDSDDWFYSDAIKNIYSKWNEIFENERIAGIIALDSFENGQTVGTKLPDTNKPVNWIDLVYKKGMKGDKDYYIKTEILKNYKFPNYKYNKHMPPSYQYFLLSEHYDFLLLNECTKYVEYLEDGISKNKFNKYLVAPDNFARYRFDIMNLIPSWKRKIVNVIHFNSSTYLGNVIFIPEKHSNKILIYLTKPLGYILSKYIKLKANKKTNLSHRIEE